MEEGSSAGRSRGGGELGALGLGKVLWSRAALGSAEWPWPEDRGGARPPGPGDSVEFKWQ